MSFCHKHKPQADTTLFVSTDRISIGEVFGMGSEPRVPVRLCVECGALFIWKDDYKKKEEAE